VRTVAGLVSVPLKAHRVETSDRLAQECVVSPGCAEGAQGKWL
jgi:hypothetical protein